MFKNKSLARYRERRGLTLKALYNLTGIRPETISRLENGTITNPTLRTVELLSHALEVKVTDLIDESDITR